jgi:hypothetical protein
MLGNPSQNLLARSFFLQPVGKMYVLVVIVLALMLAGAPVSEL